ncbi:MAG: hypothetical protein CSB15_00110 [Clostridiales bacterium]|nr:MAG: hypothetical protein CSB15_00110 [Clostridiales bacterium]
MNKFDKDKFSSIFKEFVGKEFVSVDENGRPINKKKSNVKMPSFKDVFKFFGLPLIIVFLVVVFLTEATYTVNEMESAIVLRFGKIKAVVVSKDYDLVKKQIEKSDKFSGIKVIKGKGLKFKVPFLDDVEKFTSQLITYKTRPGEVTTLDKKKIVLDNNAQWTIVNPALFRITMKSITNGNTRLDDLMFSQIREYIGKTKGSKLISDKNYVYSMTTEIKDNINKSILEYGMIVKDVRIAKTEFPKQNNQNIFKRMRTEREKMANKLRAEGDEQYAVIKAESDKKASIIKTEAYAKAEKIKGEGEAGAAKIYADAYKVDPEFYSFYRTLQTYKKSLNKNARVVISSDSDFAKYLFNYKLKR